MSDSSNNNNNNVNKLLAEFISETVAKRDDNKEAANGSSSSLLAGLVKSLHDNPSTSQTSEEREKFVASANQVADSIYPGLIKEIIENSKKDESAAGGNKSNDKSEETPTTVSGDVQDKIDLVNAVVDEGLEKHLRDELDNENILNIVKKAIGNDKKTDEEVNKKKEGGGGGPLTPLELDLIKNRLRNLLNNIKPKILELYKKTKQEEEEKEPEKPATPTPSPIDQAVDDSKKTPVAKPDKDVAATAKPDESNPEEKKSDGKASKDDGSKKKEGEQQPTVIKLVLRIFIKGLDTSKFKPVVSVNSPSKSSVAAAGAEAPKKSPSNNKTAPSSSSKHRDTPAKDTNGEKKVKESEKKEDKKNKPSSEGNKDHVKSSSKLVDDGSKSKRNCKVEPKPPKEEKKSCEKPKKVESSSNNNKSSSTSSQQKQRSSGGGGGSQLPTEYFNIIYSQFDQDKDNYISAVDLAKTLAHVYSLPEFDQEAADELINKYDQNRDKRIDVGEFWPLFDGLARMHKEFVDADYANDANGVLDAQELAQVFAKRGHTNLPVELFHWIVLESSKDDRGRVGAPSNGLSFDKCVRVFQTFDKLVEKFKQNK